MPNPKTITAKIVVPEWAKWVATDKDGEMYVFSNKPEHHTAVWASDFGKYKQVFKATPPRNWRKTLRRVK